MHLFEIPTGTANGPLRRVRIDTADIELIAGHSWRAKLDARNGKYYARCSWCPGEHKNEVRMHRLVLGLSTGDGWEADHLNGDTLDNRRANLRRVTHAQNMQNQPSRRGASSRHRAVHWEASRRKWRARVHHEGRDYDLGRYDSEDAAAAAVHAFFQRFQPYAVESRAMRLED